MGLFKKYCDYGCGAEKGFCQCGKSDAADRKVVNRARVVQGGKVVQGKPTAQKTVRRKK